MYFLLVITGTVITAVTRAGSLHATISIINVYKEGNLAIQQAGKNMSAKIIVVCKQCPLIRRGKYTNITALCVYKIKHFLKTLSVKLQQLFL